MSKQVSDHQNDPLTSNSRPQHQPRSQRLSYALPRTPPALSGTQTPQASTSAQMNPNDLAASLSSSTSTAQKQHPENKPQTDSSQAALQAELEAVQQINLVIEGVLGSLDKARTNMNTLSTTITQASTLLDTWTRILSQTEHNQRLLLHPAWEGASQDIADAENETLTRQRDQQRRETEEAARRQALEEQRRKQEQDRERRKEEAERKQAVTRTPRAGGRAGAGVGAGAPGRGGVARASTTTAASAGPASTSTTTGPKAAMTVAERRAAGRAAVSGYGRVGSAGTKAARGRGRGTAPG